ncbi:aminoglycoside 6-adenylyltransferase [Lederbergia citrea]|uniref:Aminoglycoside 6-adenylyltransferase n=1 Tax=Lederbergia citrea TaxID=2833581 RepID=A0A942Z3X6_9BACI|nr:aminoglycoside 6-adenylyltransferase [Lederbergia citrea]MBS4203405.1 aminoglycoside 6-adenylyltransferase [Lederbergia citrea]MBS4221922.1 aminoglycoside 6-adenylyltransferase [Lederbergia citrea]
MRTEKEMLTLIVSIAEKDDRIRAVMMNGSRVNSNVIKDRYQDYDIVYYVKDVESFTDDHSWVDVFGKQIIMQMPEGMALFPSEWPGFSYLMLFTDGNRIDLTLLGVEEIEKQSSFDSLSVILLDKDNLLPKLSRPNDSDYVTKKPTEEEFADCQNEFWWVATNVAKGLKRNELPYAKSMMEGPVRQMLVLMLQWHIGSAHDFVINTGKDGKWLERYLEKSLWKKFVATYPGGDYTENWESLFEMCALFEEVTTSVGNKLGFQPSSENEKVLVYLRKVFNY